MAEPFQNPPQDHEEPVEQAYLSWLQSIGAIREDGTLDRDKIRYTPAQTFEELEALMAALESNRMDDGKIR